MMLPRSGLPALALLSTLAVAACGSSDDDGGGQVREDGGQDQTDEGDTVTLGDGGRDQADGGEDPGVIVLTCEGVDDGTSCGSMGGLICLNDECVTSACGDGYADDRREEQCDDGNTAAADGCEPDCKYMCSEIGDCDDGNACNGNEVCDTADHLCVGGMTAQDETPCTSPAVADGECRSGTCVPEGCGDTSVEGAEECDDGNQVPGDGCEPTCTFSCEADADCSDNDVCNGVETCDLETHACALGAALDCEANDECSQGACDPIAGCTTVLIDGDGDRYPPATLPCGTDCDDTRADVNPGQVELCDEVDQDCDGEPQPENTPVWYVDCDGDGYAAERATKRTQCEEPAPSACGGRWTTRVPDGGDPATFDCFDDDNSVYPGQPGWFAKPSGSGYDYNCSTREEVRYPSWKISSTASCFSSDFTGGCVGSSGWVGELAACGDRAEYTECQGGLAVEEAGGRIIIPEPCGRIGCCARVVVERTQECH